MINPEKGKLYKTSKLVILCTGRLDGAINTFCGVVVNECPDKGQYGKYWMKRDFIEVPPGQAVLLTNHPTILL